MEQSAPAVELNENFFQGLGQFQKGVQRSMPGLRVIQASNDLVSFGKQELYIQVENSDFKTIALSSARITYRVTAAGAIAAQTLGYTSHLQFLYGRHCQIGNYLFTGQVNDDAMYGQSLIANEFTDYGSNYGEGQTGVALIGTEATNHRLRLHAFRKVAQGDDDWMQIDAKLTDLFPQLLNSSGNIYLGPGQKLQLHLTTGNADCLTPIATIPDPTVDIPIVKLKSIKNCELHFYESALSQPQIQYVLSNSSVFKHLFIESANYTPARDSGRERTFATRPDCEYLGLVFGTVSTVDDSYGSRAAASTGQVLNSFAAMFGPSAAAVANPATTAKSNQYQKRNGIIYPTIFKTLRITSNDMAGDQQFSFQSYESSPSLLRMTPGGFGPLTRNDFFHQGALIYIPLAQFDATQLDRFLAAGTRITGGLNINATNAPSVADREHQMGDIEDAYIPANIPGDYQIMMWTVAYKYCRIVNGRYESL